ncbi:uncharacterized protein LOC116287481 [Actinia tenebrosa]|uniref:Uncharacterized protein LOC116287481 n=1 Tax=Actinia tenebrosa TaxID=6105 RepID=A0A6P8H335_ACTTE|nr:uncharacterized protein LOC116287481 [Actinia tenebrosa]
MKILVVVVLTCLVLALAVDGYGIQEDLDRLDHQEERERTVKTKSPYVATHSNKLAAQICKPFFAACRQNAADKAGVKRCFAQFLNGCMQKIRTQLDGLEQCVANAGSDFSQVQDCISPSTKY